MSEAHAHRTQNLALAIDADRFAGRRTDADVDSASRSWRALPAIAATDEPDGAIPLEVSLGCQRPRSSSAQQSCFCASAGRAAS